MNELKVRRVAIACDAACDIRVAVGEAAALAGRWNAALHGIFVEDENLYRLAALPFGRQMTLSPAISEDFSGADLEKVSSALGASMRRAVSEAAAQHRLEWSFGVVRDLPSKAALTGIDADFLVVEAAPRAFYGSWRPRSSWYARTQEYSMTTLIRRQKPTKSGTVLVLWSGQADREKTLASGILMAGPEDEITVLVGDGSPDDIASVRRMAEHLASPRKDKIRLETAATDTPSLLQKIDEFKPVLLVVDAGDAAGPAIGDLLENTQYDVLLVR
jgi:hypothetical protein